MLNNPPAFPAEVAFGQEYIQTGANVAKYSGMTLLDAAALKALPWALGEVYYFEQTPTFPSMERKTGEAHYEAAANAAYTAAQAMLTERARRGGDDD